MKKLKAHDYISLPHEEVQKEIALWMSQYQGRNIKRAEKVAIEQRIFKDLKQGNERCARCSRTDNLTLDHIIPIRLLADFGCDITRTIIEGNYQLLCRPCNIFKGGRLDFSIPETKHLLIKLLENL